MANTFDFVLENEFQQKCVKLCAGIVALHGCEKEIVRPG